MDIIPAIDIINGECVRLVKGDYGQKTVYEKDPVIIAKRFSDAGIKRMHLVDLDGALKGHIVNGKVLEKIKKETNLIVDFGGGIKTSEEVEKAFDYGADKITCGSIAARNRDLVLTWIQKYGKEKLILGADCKNRKISVGGWTEESNFDVIDFIESYRKDGLIECISTDISKDGMLTGPSFELYNDILKRVPDLFLIASGGVSSYKDLLDLRDLGLKGAIVGKAYLEGRISIEEMAKFGD